MSEPLQPSLDSIQRLVRALVGDQAADDVAQEAWLSALRKRIAGPELSRWIAGAARKIVRSRRRDEARRRERELRTARPELAPSALDTAAELEVVARLVEAVQQLEEPYRTAVVLRHVEGLPPGPTRTGPRRRARVRCSRASRSRPLAGVFLRSGELLVDVLADTRLFTLISAHVGAPRAFSPAVPNDPALVDLQLYVQGYCSGAPGGALGNAIGALVGR